MITVKRGGKRNVAWFLGVFIMFLGMLSGGCGNNPPDSSTATSDMPVEANMSSSVGSNPIPADQNQMNASMNAQDVGGSMSAPAVPPEILAPSATPPGNMENENTEADNQGASGSETTVPQPAPENMTPPPTAE